MPTAAKLFAAVAFALVGFLAAEIFKPHLPEGTQFGFFSPISALIGLVCGWRVIGREVGHGWWESANSGMKTVVAMLALALLIFSTEEMLVLAFRRSYDSPMEAVIGTISLGVDFVQKLFVPDVLITLFAGGILGGLLAEWASRRWR
jgi:hypothetical protein